MTSQQTLVQVLKESRARLYPSLRNPSWLILRHRRRIIEAGVKRLPAAGLVVLDIGGRLQPYRALLGDRVRDYVAIDPQLTPLVSVAAIAQALPFRDMQFDIVFCTQVFEYLPDPALAAEEIRRVLRKGGLAFISAPAVFIRDSDKEYWRFLPEGLLYLLRNFEMVDVIPEGNSVTGLFRTLNVFLVSFARPRILVPVIAWTVIPLINIVGSILEKLGGKNDHFAANFSVWVRK
ncbi:MAG: class I SAM-dependent methyltransferase [Terriglobales bacterium]|jgi:SAM-dependent methyltransferase